MSSDLVTDKTRQIRSHEIAQLRRHVSGPGSSFETTQLQQELKEISKNDRENLLMSLNIQTKREVPADQILAMKANLAIPWKKLSVMRRLIYT